MPRYDFYCEDCKKPFEQSLLLRNTKKAKATRATRSMLADWPSCCVSIISLRFITASMACER